MENDNDAPERPESTHQDGEQGPPPESGSEGSTMSRRDMLKKGAYAAPAIMTIGSVPSFASGGSPCPGNSGDAPHNSGGKCPGNSEGKGNSNAHGNAGGPSGSRYGSEGYGSSGNSNYAGSDYGSSNSPNSGYGSGGYGNSDYGGSYGDND